jgi:glucose/arabinose dehydrogenase
LAAWVCLVGQSGSSLAVPPGFVDAPFAGGLNAPTAMAFAPDGRLFVTEQGGAVRVVKSGALLRTPFARLTVDSAGERGLLGIAFDPNFGANRFVYVHHTVPGPRPHNRISRFTARGDVAQAGSRVTIFDLDPLSDATRHNGGAIHFGPDGKIYVGVGDNTSGRNAQSLTSLHGKILRINPNGTVPADNPATFPGISGRTTGVHRAIWAVGLRNPYTFAIQPGSGVMFINDVGEAAVEEVNRGLRGRNYGWPRSEGPAAAPQLTDPHFYYRHSGRPTGCAVSGGAFYNPPNKRFPARFVGKYFFADFCGGWIYYLDPAVRGKATLFHDGLNRPIDLAVDQAGSLYYLQRGNGQVRRIRYTGG